MFLKKECLVKAMVWSVATEKAKSAQTGILWAQSGKEQVSVAGCEPLQMNRLKE